jgi:hypothetical protein
MDSNAANSDNHIYDVVDNNFDNEEGWEDYVSDDEEPSLQHPATAFIGTSEHNMTSNAAISEIPENDVADSEPDNREDDYESEDEKEVFNQMFDEMKAKMIAGETKVQQLESAFRQQDTAPPLRDLRGQWTLYSSAFLECIKQDIWDDKPYQMEGYEIGTMDIGGDEIEREGSDLSADLTITFCSEPIFDFDFKAPKYASAIPLQTSCCLNSTQETIDIEMSFLGSGMQDSF